MHRHVCVLYKNRHWLNRVAQSLWFSLAVPHIDTFGANVLKSEFKKSQVMSAFIPKTDPILPKSIFTLCLFFVRSNSLVLCQISDILYFSGVVSCS